MRPPEGRREPSYLIAQYRESAAAIADELTDDNSRKAFAESFCAKVVAHVWDQRVRRRRTTWRLEPPAGGQGAVDPAAEQLATDIAALLCQLDLSTSDYLLGGVYTILLPERIRSDWGIYYTPPAIVQRLLSDATFAGTEWLCARVIDPACGGAAFLAPVAVRMWQTLSKRQMAPGTILDHIASHLSGVGIDPFAAWMSQALAEIRLVELAVAAGRG